MQEAVAKPHHRTIVLQSTCEEPRVAVYKDSVYVLNYHFVWSTKYRKRVLFPPVDSKLSEITQIICNKDEIGILQSEIIPDHVHLWNPSCYVGRAGQMSAETIEK